MRPLGASSRLVLPLALASAALGIAPVEATLLELGPRRTASLPGESWIPPARSVLRVGLTRPVAVPGVLLSWAGARLRGGRHWGLDLRVADLRAGLVAEQGSGLALTSSAAGVLLGAGVAGEMVRVGDLPLENRLRGEARLGFSLGGLLVAARWEGPVRADPVQGRPAAEIVTRLEDAGWCVAVSRRTSRFGQDAIWSGGFRIELHPQLALSSTIENEAADVGILVRRGSLGLAISAPVASPVGAGPAFMLEWRP